MAPSLNGAQKSAISSSWAAMSKDTKTKQDNGALLFSMLWEKYPDTKKYFGHMDTAAIASSGVGKAHSISVFSGIGAFVECLEDADTFSGLVTKLARNHQARNIGKDQFGNMRGCFGDFLDKSLGGASGDVKGAWDALLAILQESL